MHIQDRLLFLDSTQNEAHRLVASGAKGDLIICARSQKVGRGRHGNNWISSIGGLYYSLLLQDKQWDITGSHLSFIIGNAVYDTIKFLLPANQNCVLKWPNDILINGRKIAGILTESRCKTNIFDVINNKFTPDMYYVVGVGINMNNFPEDLKKIAISLEMAGGKKTSFEDMIDLLSKNIVFWLDLYNKLGFKEIIDNWKKKSFNVGSVISTNFNGSKITGVYHDLDQDTGELILEIDGQEIKISSGEIFLE
jgi:BirA family biotin operon repressor/biotin-[acetyl-CoA-carboxylase] ligase